MAILPVFTLHLGLKVNVKQLSVGKFDGKQPCLVGGTPGGKVFIHNPQQATTTQSGKNVNSNGRAHSALQGGVSLLNINQAISSVACGIMDPSSDRDVLIVGTSSNVLAYDVRDNKDLFYKEVADSVNQIVIGQLGSKANPLAVVGGDCSIVGFDYRGNDLFWTVTGDNVCSLALMDFNGNSKNELLSGSEDYDIRIFSEDVIIEEISETQIVTSLHPLGQGLFAYGLQNGTLGVYRQSVRLWRIKSKHVPTCMCSYDIDGDGVDELVSGWSSGKVEARKVESGNLVFKEFFPKAIVGIVKADYRQEGRELLICCSQDGEVRGYAARDDREDTVVVSEASRIATNRVDAMNYAEKIRELNEKKTALLMELKNYETAVQVGGEKGEHGKKNATTVDPYGKQSGIVIPANTRVESSLYVSEPKDETEKPNVELFLSTTNDTIIRSVIIFAEGMFTGESHCVHPRLGEANNSVIVQLFPMKDAQVEMFIKVYVAYRMSTQFHVLELARTLPRYSMYQYLGASSREESNNLQNPFQQPKGFVKFHVNERLNRILLWINLNFLLKEDLCLDEDHMPPLHFCCLRDYSYLSIEAVDNAYITIRTDDMELAGDFLQNMCSFFNVTQLSSVAEFPDQFELAEKSFELVRELQLNRQKLSSEMADCSNMIKNLIVRVEDYRVLHNMKLLKQGYVDLMHVNRDMFTSYVVRSNNHSELVQHLKLVNRTMQMAGKLRIGIGKSEVINGCKEAVKQCNFQLFLKIIRTGVA